MFDNLYLIREQDDAESFVRQQELLKSIKKDACADDIIKLAMVGVYRRLKAEGLQAKLILQVHDELIVECPTEEAERVREILRYEMEHTAELAVPLTVDAHIGKSWAEAH